MDITVYIDPGIQPLERGAIEDELCEAISEATGGEAESVGGGTLLGDHPVSDFQLEVTGSPDPQVVEEVCRKVLSAIEFSLPTLFTVRVDDHEFTIRGQHSDPPS